MACVTKRNGKWVVDYREFGKRRVLQFPNKGCAEKYLRELKLRVVNQKSGFRPLVDLPLAEATERYLNNVTAKKASGKALVGEKKYFRRLNAFFEGRHVSDITLSDLEELQVALSEKLGNSTINRHFNCYRHFFNKCVDWGLIGFSPAAKLTSMKQKSVRRRVVSDAELNQMISLAKPWMKRVLVFAAYTGVRASEISSLEWQDIDFDADLLTIYSKKGSGDERVRKIPMAKPLRHLMWKLRIFENEQVKRDDSQGVFRNSKGNPASSTHLSREARRLAKRAGLDGVSLHCLRHTFSTRISEQGGNLEEVQRLLGHANIATTQRYLHMSDAALKVTVDRLAESQKIQFLD
jgi:integrase